MTTTTLVPTTRHYYLVTMNRGKIKHIDTFHRRGGRVIDRINYKMMERMGTAVQYDQLYLMASDDRLTDEEIAFDVLVNSIKVYG